MPDRAAVVYDCLYPVTVGGGERVYRRLAELLVERGYPTDYVTRTLWDGVPPEATFHPVGVWSGEIYDPRGVRRTSAALIFALHCFAYFVRRRGDYALVIASALPVLTVIAVRFALLGSRTRVVADWLEIWPARKWRAYAGTVSGTIAAVLQRIGIGMVREHTVNSSFTARHLRSIRPRAAVTVLGLLDLVDEQDAQPAASPAELLFVGRLIDDKRAELVPAVVAKARESIPDLIGIVVGDGPRREQLERAVTTSPARGAVEVLGRIDDAGLRRRRARAAVLFAPSVREGFGLAVAESAAAGVPVVVARHPDNASVDLVEPGVNGELADADDVDALAAAVVRVIEAGARMRASTRSWFGEARRTRTLSAALDALLAAGPRGPRV